jgi:hypothetical protein
MWNSEPPLWWRNAYQNDKLGDVGHITLIIYSLFYYYFLLVFLYCCYI